ncbi:alpha/beta hydrolase [Herbiconiux moechotypicola]|uniref:Alpha/beta hydrolase n=1 Tax=Herbiconiux moechotypicola TaxID=637393 RepID=A0ABN3DKZ2_9MICO|nr:alpha/beta hydrolase [Herbiconiux moechotypicola]MCS5730101.1 alpha/beta hydrolase [Herbiconiux moechotypicola]
MDVVMIPGFWLQDSSWEEAVGPLRAAGHTVHTPTLGGLHAVEEDRSQVTLASQVAEVVSLVDDLVVGDESGSQVVLVGHSGGGAIIHAVVDQRPEAIARAVYVDTWPTADGQSINEDIPAVGDDIPLPAWDAFGEADLLHLSDELRERLRTESVPQPVRVARDPQVLGDQARFEVPVTVVATTFTGEELDGYIASGHPLFAEFPPMRSVTVVELPTSHWPQLTRPAELGRILVDAVGASGAA